MTRRFLRHQNAARTARCSSLHARDQPGHALAQRPGERKSRHRADGTTLEVDQRSRSDY